MDCSNTMKPGGEDSASKDGKSTKEEEINPTANFLSSTLNKQACCAVKVKQEIMEDLDLWRHNTRNRLKRRVSQEEKSSSSNAVGKRVRRASLDELTKNVADDMTEMMSRVNAQRLGYD